MTSEIPEDFVDLLYCLREEECQFVIVSAHALERREISIFACASSSSDAGAADRGVP